MFWTLLIFTLGLSPYQRSNAEIQRLVELLKTVILNDCAASTVSLNAGQRIDGLIGASLTRFLLYGLTQPQLLST